MNRILKPGSWGRKLLGYGLPVLLAAFAVNHVEYYFRQKAASNAGSQSVVVRAETGTIGHRTIGVDEAGTSTDNALFLKFTTLGQWDYDAKSPTDCPDAVKKLSGRQASCIGFMYPLEAGSELKTFCLLRTTQTCCYGPRPQYNQYLLVEMKSPVKFERMTPVIVKGKFYPDAQPGQGFIYRMEGTSVTPVREQEMDLDPAQASKETGLPLFDFAPLADVEKRDPKELPAELLALDGKRVVVAGYLLDRREGESPQILVGKEWWDGVSRGKPPTIYTAVAVFPRDVSQMPPVWKDKGLFTGILHVETNPQEWSKAGIVSLRQAMRGLSEPRVAGPVLRPAYEALMLAVLLSVGLWGGRSERKVGGNV